MREIEVASVDELEEGKPFAYKTDDGQAFVLIKRGSEVYALEDACSHMGVPLSKGCMVDEYILKCSAHGAKFDIRDGKHLSFPAVSPVKTYRVKIKSRKVFLVIDD